jgi:N,N-dimethylformamidase
MKITGYADKISARPGETLRFMVNCERPRYRADIVRLVCGDLNPDGPGIREQVVPTPANTSYKGRSQSIEAGSYVLIPNSPLLQNLKSFTVQAMLWPTTPDSGTQAIVSKWQDRRRSGFALVIRAGRLALQLGDGQGNVEVVSTSKPLLARQWYFVAASYDAETRRVTLYQEPQTDYPTVSDAARVRKKIQLERVGSNQSALMFGALRTGSGKGKLDQKFNGKIDSPRLANRVLDRSEMERLKSGVPVHLQQSVVGAWDFSRDISATAVTDTSPNRLHGETVNMPARGMKGYNWSGESMDWKQAPQHYGAIHFHDDDVYDAGWEVDFSLTVPAELKSGLYAARLRSGAEEDYIPFVVKPAKGKEKKLAFLLPTASYMAYANEHMATNAGLIELLSGRLAPLDKNSLFLNEHREYGGSCYDSHSDGSGVCYSSRLRPILNMRPKHISALGGDGSSLWQFNADTHITDWLETQGYDFDVITDEDCTMRGSPC